MFSSLMTNHKKHPKIHQYVIHSGIKYACIYADFHYTETFPKSALTDSSASDGYGHKQSISVAISKHISVELRKAV